MNIYDYRDLQNWLGNHGTPCVFIKLQGYCGGNTDYQAAKRPLDKAWTRATALMDHEITTWVAGGLDRTPYPPRPYRPISPSLHRMVASSFSGTRAR